ncbi:hypothetical protein ACJJTC_001779 [Scirpophaga incertulas]
MHMIRIMSCLRDAVCVAQISILDGLIPLTDGVTNYAGTLVEAHRRGAVTPGGGWHNDNVSGRLEKNVLEKKTIFGIPIPKWRRTGNPGDGRNKPRCVADTPSIRMA